MSLVLVADDEPAVLEVLSEVVLDLGHEVVRAYDGREALQLARNQRPHLVVTDHMMPRLSGADLCRQMRREATLKDVPVILLSAALTEGIPEAQAFLPKPFELSDFEALVRRTLQQASSQEERSGVQASASEALVHGVARELRSPLASARGHLDQLRAELLPQAAGGRGALAALSGELESMERLVQALLDASRLAEGRVQLQRGPADLSALLQGAVAEWRRHPLACDFAVSVPVEPVEAHVDSSRVRQVLDALLFSAVRETAPGSTLHVGLTASPMLATFTVGEGLWAGLPMEGGREVAGAEQGLGLFVASELARLHGGSVAVQDGPRAAYSVMLPRRA